MLIVGVPGTSVGPDMEGVRECSAGGQPGAGDTASGGTLTLAAVPIGTPADASSRLTQVLAQARIVAAEDTRLASHLVSPDALAPGAFTTTTAMANMRMVRLLTEPGLAAGGHC